MRKFVIASVFLLMLYQTPIAQEKGVPFSLLKINAGILVNINRNLLHEFWDPARGFYVYCESPFYFGDITLGAFYNQFNNKTYVPSFKNFFVFAGWGRTIDLPLNLSITSGFKAGSNIFSFNADSISFFGQTESEFAVGVFARLNLELFSRLEMSLSADLENIFTNRRIKLIYISAGAGYRIPTPAWFRDFLK